jgi:hypothetical protein
MSLPKSIREGFNIPPRWKPPSLYYTGYSNATQEELFTIMHQIEHEINPMKPYYRKEYLILPNGNKLLIRDYKEVY